MTYLLDTDTFSNLARNHARVELRYMLVGKAATCISTVTVNEIEYGRSLHPDQVKRHNARIDALLSEIPALPFDFDDASTFQDLESGEQVPVVPQSFRAEYRRLIQEHIARLSTKFSEQRIDYFLANTKEPLDKALFSYLSSREKLMRVR